tara:strand:- start:1354 stop:2115 length:762 start_codon:yes stop_codon:yes gene_type:complete
MINWDEVNKLIKNTKNPLTLLLSLIVNYKNISKENFDFLIRIYIRYHYKILLNYPVVKLFNTLNVKINPNIIKFYKFYIKLIKLVNNVVTLKQHFFKYSKLTINEFYIKIKKESDLFKSYFDATYSNNTFHCKLMQYFCNDQTNIILENEITNRLRLSLKTINIQFAKKFEIPIMSYDEYNKLNGMDKFKFVNNYYEKVNETYKVINLNLKKIQVYKEILINLSQPKKINITINNTLNSETENEDVEIFLISK